MLMSCQLNLKKAETGLKNKISDPSTQQKFDNVFRMIDSLAGKKK